MPGVALDSRLLILCLDRASQSHGAINCDDLDILSHHGKRAVTDDHLANICGELEVRRVIRLIGRGLGLIIPVARVLAGVIRVGVL